MKQNIVICAPIFMGDKYRPANISRIIEYFNIKAVTLIKERIVHRNLKNISFNIIFVGGYTNLLPNYIDEEKRAYQYFIFNHSSVISLMYKKIIYGKNSPINYLLASDITRELSNDIELGLSNLENLTIICSNMISTEVQILWERKYNMLPKILEINHDSLDFREKYKLYRYVKAYNITSQIFETINKSKKNEK